MDCAKDEVKVYDSLYTSVNDDTQTVIAALINSKSPHIKIKLMNIAKQLGGTDCGLYAIAIITCLAYGEDPTCLVFDKTMLRPHLVECFEKRAFTHFLSVKDEEWHKQLLQSKYVLFIVYADYQNIMDP